MNEDRTHTETGAKSEPQGSPSVPMIPVLPKLSWLRGQRRRANGFVPKQRLLVLETQIENKKSGNCNPETIDFYIQRQMRLIWPHIVA